MPDNPYEILLFLWLWQQAAGAIAASTGAVAASAGAVAASAGAAISIFG